MKFIPNGTGKFRFWCQKVLPLVYDDSLSYYEVLCKIVDYINNLIKNDKEFADEIDLFRDEISEMQKAIDISPPINKLMSVKF